MGSLVRERCMGSQAEAIGCLRTASKDVRNAINRLCDLGEDEDSAGLIRETREQLMAAMHLIDGVGVALGRAMR